MGRTANPLPCYLVCLFMLESHECSRWESTSRKNTGRSEVRAILSSLFLGSASRAARPGKRLSRNSSPGHRGSGPQGWGRAARGPRDSQNCSKWQHYKQTISLTYPGRLGQLRAGERALGRHKGTMEKLFQPEPTARRRDSASGPTSRARLSSPAGASARSRFAAPSAAVAGAISKSFQEVSGLPQPASCLGAVLPAAAPPAPPREPCRGAPGRAPAPLLCGCGAPGSAGWS